MLVSWTSEPPTSRRALYSRAFFPNSFIQAGGAGILVSADDADGFDMGENVILGGLILQILIFGFFCVVASIWHRRLLARPTAASAELPWTKLIWFLYAASVCITLRNLLRVIEYAMGKVRLIRLIEIELLLIWYCRMATCSLTSGPFTSTTSCLWRLRLLFASGGTTLTLSPAARTTSSLPPEHSRVLTRCLSMGQLQAFQCVNFLFFFAVSFFFPFTCFQGAGRDGWCTSPLRLGIHLEKMTKRC